jgi:invasion protein IalB
MTTFMFVSSRPGEKVKDEVSLLIGGYTFKPATDATAQVGNAAFPMYTQKDGAWIKNAAEEARLVEAMRKGADMTVKATTDKGTETIDSFSLKGLSQALDRVAAECK